MFERITRRRAPIKALVLALAFGTSALALAQDWRYNDHDRDPDRYDRDYDRDLMHVARHSVFRMEYRQDARTGTRESL